MTLTPPHASGQYTITGLTVRIKDALDPNGILNPGRAGIWPQRLRGRGL